MGSVHATPSLPQTTVMISPAVAVGEVGWDRLGFEVTYSGGVDGSTIVLQWGDGEITNATAVNFQAWFFNTYFGVGVFKVTAEVFTAGCFAPCTATAAVTIVPRIHTPAAAPGAGSP